MGKHFLFAVLLLCSVHAAYAQLAVPELWGQRIHDESKVLSQFTIDSLEVKLKKYEDTTTNQIAVLIIPSLNGEVLEQYSLKVVEKWKLGTRKNDNGVLVLVVTDDHKTRIEIGHGLEGVFTDIQSNRIVSNEMIPSFKHGDYDTGLKRGIDGIMKSIAGEYKATAVASDLNTGETLFAGFFIFGILGVFTFIALFSKGCAGWGIYVFLIPFYALFPVNLIGQSASIILLATYIIGLPIAKIIISRSEWGKKKIGKFQSGSGGGSGSGWSVGSGWSSGGGGGGGFSGGGGSFGGGGSSGSW